MQNNIFIKFKNYLSSRQSQKGVSLVIAFFVMTIILAIVLAITTLLYSEIKMIRNIGNSVVAFYVADSGVEKVLYYDRKIIVSGATRGLCSMFSYDAETAPNECPESGEVSGLNAGLYCIPVGTGLRLTDELNHTDGCDVNVCDACEVSFNTTFPDNQKSYLVTATVIPNESGGASSLTIGSTGSFKSLSRKVELFMTKTEAADEIVITDAYATPLSSEVGVGIAVVAEVEATNGVSSIKAYIKTSYNEDYASIPDLRIRDLILSSGTIFNGTFSREWTGSAGVYYVDLVVVDVNGNQLTQTNLQPYSF